MPLKLIIKRLTKSQMTEPMLKLNAQQNKLPKQLLVLVMILLIMLLRHIVLKGMLGIGLMILSIYSKTPLCLKDLELVTVGITVEMLPLLLITNIYLDVMTWVKSQLIQKCHYLSNLLLEIWTKRWKILVLYLVHLKI